MKPEPIENYFLCPFCGNQKTCLTQKMEDSTYKTFFCKRCYTRMWFFAKNSNETLKNFTKELEKMIPQFQEILKNCEKSHYKGNLLCPICLEKIVRFVPCKVKKKNKKLPMQFTWYCFECSSRGFVNSKTLPKWKFSSSILRMRLQ